MSLLTVGTVAFDSIETPFGKAERVVGGACTYISLAASYFVKDIKLVSVVGDDFPSNELNYLRKRGIDLEGLQIKKGEKSFFWAGRYHYNMNARDTLTTDLNVLANFDPVLPESYKTAQFVMLGNLTPEVQMRVLMQLKKKPKLVVMDTMNFWMDVAMDALKQVIAKVDVLTINDEEARQLSGEHSLVKAARIIHKLGPKFIIIKKGEHGALLFSGNNIFFAPALPLADVIDPTGAGDTFAGGFIGYLAKTGNTSFENMKRAVIYGSAMASFCVEEFSIEKLKKLTATQIDKRLLEFKKLGMFELE
ncbi:MAG: bifunctional hydroxymethylpyrimidine kinase/phosphomethylpyrimidine kinase [Saprospiraceae bacterium]|nr:bifunctional hydroxymethylpyrimidine kinase/phosphomethylpyrimidine kinase [Saprospiraceae bacterium]MBP7699515.1 bifunctional hydroxymethylpyrimidine kinase/phosphomethylpyrimidine kinase [Saprospiraceae bacterium]